MATLQPTLAFMESQVAYIERQAYRVRYPSIQYPTLVPITSEAPDWINTITHYSMDMTGSADFISAQADDFPLADASKQQFNVQVEMLGAAYQYNTEEMMQAQMTGMNLSAERAIAARRAVEEKIDDLVLNGYSALKWDSLINSSLVPKSDAAATGSGSLRTWKSKTADQVLGEINELLERVHVDSLTVEMADTILMPWTLIHDISTRRISEGVDNTILSFLRQNNVYTATTGRPLRIRPLRGLESQSNGRIIAYRFDPEILRFHLPMPFRFLEPMRKSAMTWQVQGVFRTGGLEIRLPNAMRYLDETVGS